MQVVSGGLRSGGLSIGRFSGSRCAERFGGKEGIFLVFLSAHLRATFSVGRWSAGLFLAILNVAHLFRAWEMVGS